MQNQLAHLNYTSTKSLNYYTLFVR